MSGQQTEIRGHRDGTVTAGGAPLDHEPSLAVRSHSPSGFAWGYLGSGPSQLALAILLWRGLGRQDALAFYQYFKEEVVAKWPGGQPFVYPVEQLDQWIEGRRGRQTDGCRADRPPRSYSR